MLHNLLWCGTRFLLLNIAVPSRLWVWLLCAHVLCEGSVLFHQTINPMTIDTKLPPAVIDLLETVFEHDSPEAIRNTLIEIYLVFLTHEHEHLPVNFDDMARHVNALSNVLKLSAQELKG
ncbi:hypothetical protein [Chryseolinea lacunae]|uniref:Uncharacterized protein n=1 Tax=Chryseolinea lacunae TaxID=2801331 RepID=A0ABS1KTE1_9BACT|nr:hypothetical protein [Chryseolinea lacunae]MBL0742639.1 hypothetical protein [Chryseolinea lacunae]